MRTEPRRMICKHLAFPSVHPTELAELSKAPDYESGRFPGLRVLGFDVRLPGFPVVELNVNLAAYSCGGSPGLGSSPHRVPS